MLAWFFTTIWHALLGLVLLVGITGGAVIFLAREIGRSGEHDLRKCECGDCQIRRNRRWEKAMKIEDRIDKILNRPDIPIPNKTVGPYVATNQLMPYQQVQVKGEFYMVVSVDQTTRGYAVRLRSARTNKVTQVDIARENASKRYWYVVK